MPRRRWAARKCCSLNFRILGRPISRHHQMNSEKEKNVCDSFSSGAGDGTRTSCMLCSSSTFSCISILHQCPEPVKSYFKNIWEMSVWPSNKKFIHFKVNMIFVWWQDVQKEVICLGGICFLLMRELKCIIKHKLEVSRDYTELLI